MTPIDLCSVCELRCKVGGKFAAVSDFIMLEFRVGMDTRGARVLEADPGNIVFR